MITKPTVLVLGAGASNPYGYPTGKELKKIIIDEIIKSGSELHNILKHEYSADHIALFRTSLSEFDEESTIDTFLGQKSAFIDIGKLTIMTVLAKFENKNKLLASDNWYRYLFERLNTIDLSDFGKNLSIITFNYDRSIEVYLFEKIKETYHLGDKDAWKYLRQISIVHFHGKIGNLPWEHAFENRDYGEILDTNKIVRSSQRIKIIHDPTVDKSGVTMGSWQLFESAEYIFFLGFGYDPENMRRLRINTLNVENKTILGMSGHICDDKIKDIMIKHEHKLILLKENLDYPNRILEFLKRYLISA